MNSYELSRSFFDWSFENPEKITPTHVAMYFFIIEHCNRLGWKEKFGLPTTMVKEAIGIKNFRTYTNTLNELVEWGFIIMIEKSKNQYSSNIIAIAKNTIARAKAPTKALDKALQKHSTKHCNSIDSIDKQVTINKEQETIIQPPFLESKKHLIPEMANKFKDINSNYAFDEVIDYPAIKSFAEFIANRQNKSRVISDLNLTQIDNIVNEFGKIANWYKNTNCTKSLETLAKFEIQKIFNELAQSGQVGGGIKLTTNISLT